MRIRHQVAYSPNFHNNSLIDLFARSPIVWQWNDEENRAFISMDVVHSCRNYDMIVDWAKTRRMTARFDYSVRVAE